MLYPAVSIIVIIVYTSCLNATKCTYLHLLHSIDTAILHIVPTASIYVAINIIGLLHKELTVLIDYREDNPHPLGTGCTCVCHHKFQSALPKVLVASVTTTWIAISDYRHHNNIIYDYDINDYHNQKHITINY